MYNAVLYICTRISIMHDNVTLNDPLTMPTTVPHTQIRRWWWCGCANVVRTASFGVIHLCCKEPTPHMYTRCTNAQSAKHSTHITNNVDSMSFHVAAPEDPCGGWYGTLYMCMWCRRFILCKLWCDCRCVCVCVCLCESRVIWDSPVLSHFV